MNLNYLNGLQMGNRRKHLSKKEPEDVRFFLQETILIDWFYLQKWLDRSNYTDQEKKDLILTLEAYEKNQNDFDSDNIMDIIHHVKNSKMDPIEAAWRYTQADIRNKIKSK